MGGNFWYNFWMFYPAFLFQLTIHEVAHALTAKWGGDMTATYQKRLSLNPAVHIDPIGTVLVPMLMLMNSGLPLFGWARPVPVQESQFRDVRWNVVVSLAGPFSNLLLALFGTLLLSFGLRLCLLGEANQWWQLSTQFYQVAWEFSWRFVALNWVLCLFNLIPVPPLDGSHVVYHFFIRGHGRRYGFWEFYYRFGFFLFFVLFFFTPFGGFLFRAVRLMTNLTLHLLGFPLIQSI